ncbi:MULTISPECIES: mechanosensitive ion channel family protein [Elizabethkingia]|uniref:Small-conductance mechanosensitive channel n=2 Tax=Elizabethkingia anophelis TaxID=1117645 RepID=A0A077EHE4_9FLAO|nr:MULTISPECIES: mechanosensitive ion channel domain-containing protein [Elizabethkingia]AIL46867.1 Small-conductance mechanosensitive channel [Elizabethkingia anophelis NUHP1]AKH95468.1 mechanosensitive ion channel protein MscS [Elizabethkingia anophelis FMS-007]AMR41508.1 mechanosensitive ion channel protein MscS [Elizabethkingia anophelis]AMX48149.1 mechanosensitive ion channel protein MscS [Elizabethkingia anophelis]AMX51608.1 mechanosensitive ion channel protein MscS [Elizabethkingia anop
MNNDLQETRDFLQQISYDINVFFAKYFDGSIAWIFQVTSKILVLLAFYFIVDLGIRLFFNFLYKVIKKNKYPFVEALYQSKFPRAMAHVIALGLCSFALDSIFYKNMHPATKSILDVIVQIGQLIVIGSAGLRLYKSVEIYYILIKENYKLIAFKAVSQTLKIFGGVILFFIAIKIVFKINSGTILGSLGAITAVMVLVFRDTILGFVTGIHVATSKNLKVGDWIGIPKYNIEGNITDISLLTTKIVNFDKTVSTIPTYDLMSTEIRNYQVMTEGNLRRIKRSMIFNIKSFRFLTKEDYEKLEKVNLISDYIITKKNEIESEKLELHNADNMLNGQQLTNIGVFRKYAENYLRNNPNIEQKEIILVRQLEITPQGMPLEIYCFTIYSNLEDYERVQSDIFDHLLVATQDFGLEVIQVNKV